MSRLAKGGSGLILGLLLIAYTLNFLDRQLRGMQLLLQLDVAPHCVVIIRRRDGNWWRFGLTRRRCTDG